MLNIPDQESARATARLVEAWNSLDIDRIAPLIHPEFENHQLPLPPVIGREAYLAHCLHWFTAIPDFHMEAVRIIAQGNVSCLESVSTGQRVGPFFGQPATERSTTVQACDLLIFEGDLLRYDYGYWDFSLVTGTTAPRAVSLTERNDQ